MAESDSSAEKSAEAPREIGQTGQTGLSDDQPAAPAAAASGASKPPSSKAPLAPAKPPSSTTPAADTTDKTAPVAPKLPSALAIGPEATVEPVHSNEAKDDGRAATDFEASRMAEEANAGPRLNSAPSLAELASIASLDLEARIVAQAKNSRPIPNKSSGTISLSGTPSAPAAPSDARPLAAYELLARSARLGDLVGLTSRIVTEAARARTPDWAFTSKVRSAAEDVKLSREDAETRFGNALDVLGTGAEGAAERALACALWAHAVAEAPRARPEEEDSLAGDVLWLAAHTAFDATTLLDRALGEDAADLWTAIADRVRRIDRGKGGALGRGEAIVACAALAASGSDRAKALCADLASEVKDSVLLRVLATGDQTTPEEVRLEGELLPTPRGPVATTFLAFTGLLFAMHAVRLTARLALAYKRPAEVSLSESGVRVKTRTELLGRTLREREHVILRAGLVRVVREVRFPRAAFYAGLLALALGSYIGVRAFVDGVRSASPSLLVVGLVIVAIGIGADFVLGTLIPGSRGRCRMAFVPRTGPTLCIGDVDMRRADDALARSLGRR